jgi:hypothetical protein
MNFGACFVNACDNRPSEPESGESTDHRSSKSTNNGILISSSIALSSALMKGTFFYFGNAKCIAPIIYFNLHNPPTHTFDRSCEGGVHLRIVGTRAQSRFRQKLYCANCSSFTWAGNGESRSVGDK